MGNHLSQINKASDGDFGVRRHFGVVHDSAQGKLLLISRDGSAGYFWRGALVHGYDCVTHWLVCLPVVLSYRNRFIEYSPFTKLR